MFRVLWEREFRRSLPYLEEYPRGVGSTRECLAVLIKNISALINSPASGLPRLPRHPESDYQRHLGEWSIERTLFNTVYYSVSQATRCQQLSGKF